MRSEPMPASLAGERMRMKDCRGRSIQVPAGRRDVHRELALKRFPPQQLFASVNDLPSVQILRAD
jgi:hypothetical protein